MTASLEPRLRQRQKILLKSGRGSGVTFLLSDPIIRLTFGTLCNIVFDDDLVDGSFKIQASCEDAIRRLRKNLPVRQTLIETFWTSRRLHRRFDELSLY